MSDLQIIALWMLFGAVAIISNILIMAFVGVIKRKEFKEFRFWRSALSGFNQAAKEYTQENTKADAALSVFVTLLLWPISVYQVTTGQYSWNKN